MSRKDYIEIAEQLNRHYKELGQFFEEKADLRDVFNDLYRDFVWMLKKDNALFDEDKFYKAVYKDK
jgi:hypothetical protein